MTGWEEEMNKLKLKSRVNGDRPLEWQKVWMIEAVGAVYEILRRESLQLWFYLLVNIATVLSLSNLLIHLSSFIFHSLFINSPCLLDLLSFTCKISLREWFKNVFLCRTENRIILILIRNNGPKNRLSNVTVRCWRKKITNENRVKFTWPDNCDWTAIDKHVIFNS